MRRFTAVLVICLVGIKSSARQDINPPCYSCLFTSASAELVPTYRKYNATDPLVSGDVRFILWRATGTQDCGTLSDVRRAAESDDPDRRLQAQAVIGFSAPECKQDASKAFQKAASLAKAVQRKSEAETFLDLSKGRFQPKFGDILIVSSLTVPSDAKTMILGESTVTLVSGMKVGTQVERVARDWQSYELGWDFTRRPLRQTAILNYHEGAFVRRMVDEVHVEIIPLSGTFVARKSDTSDKWYAADEKGVFRFNVVNDKIRYPTTHISGNVGWITDTHGISAIVAQALEYKVQVVVGCGDTEGKAKAAFYLAQHGVNVVTPADRYDYLLLGYEGRGTILGTAPIHKVGGNVVIGHQPIKFDLKEPIIAQDTDVEYPAQYYDAPARYFRRLASVVPITVQYVKVSDANQLDRFYSIAKDFHSTVIAVRILTPDEDVSLRRWLKGDPKRRAILFHSGLYPYAQGLFADFPNQVTFGDLHPRFE
jgi:hypothetical protein